MYGLSIFKNISEEKINELLKNSVARKITFQKDNIIFSKLVDDDLIGIILSGNANIVKYEYNGNRVILDNLEYDAIVGRPFLNFDNDVSIVASSDCEVLFLDYSYLMKNSTLYHEINNNIIEMLGKMIQKLNERVEILSKRSIREKLLCYFSIVSKKKKRKKFAISITYIELADYLAVDRSAMMREIKKLKDEKLISSDGKKISLNY